MYKKNLITLLIALVCSISICAQPLIGEIPQRRLHHSQRLPGVNERRLARLAKMREENIALRHRQGPWRAQAESETKKGLVLLVEFSNADGKMKAGAATQWNNRFNQIGFSGYNIAKIALNYHKIDVANEEIVETYSTNFTTTGSANSPTGFEAISANDKCSKILRNGQIFILRGEKVYTVTGQEVK